MTLMQIFIFIILIGSLFNLIREFVPEYMGNPPLLWSVLAIVSAILVWLVPSLVILVLSGYACYQLFKLAMGKEE